MGRDSDTVAFYVAANSRHFIGLVALINSLRLAGHNERIYVGDCGFVESERRRLGEHTTLVQAYGASPPHLAKFVAPLAHPHRIMILVDADVVVTRPLTDVIERARNGKVVAFADRVASRFDERWSTLLDLGPLRPQPYMNSGVVALDEGWREMLEQVANGCELIEVHRSAVADGTPGYPFFYLDQDVLNAVLGTYPPDAVDVLEHRLAPFPPFSGLRITDEARLECSYSDGVEPFALHHIAKKPWLTATRWSVYTQLLSRLLLWPDVALRLLPDEVPLRLRTGRLAWVEKRRNDALASVYSVRSRLALRSRLRRRLQGDGIGIEEEHVR